MVNNFIARQYVSIISNKKPVLLFLLFGILLSGCSSRKEVINNDLSYSPAWVMASVNALPATIQTFTALGSIDVQTPRIAQSAGFDIAVKKPDSVRLVIEGPFGITIGKALLTRTTFMLYNAFSNILYEGNTEKGLHLLPNIDGFKPEFIVDAMSGIRRFDDNFNSPDSFYTSDHSYFLVFANDTSKTVFKVNGVSLRITGVYLYSDSGVLLREESYSYTHAKDGTWQPSSALINVPEQSTTVSIYFDDVAINPGIEALMISFPDDAEHVIIN